MACLKSTTHLLVLTVLGLGAAASRPQTAPAAHLMVQLGLPGNVRALAYSPDGRYFLANSYNAALLFDLASGRQLRSFQGHTDVVTSVAFSPDGNTVATGSNDETTRLWDVRTGKELRRLEGQFGRVVAVEFSSDGQSVLTGGGRSAVLFDASSGQQLNRFETIPGRVNSVAMSKDNRSVLTGGGKKLSLWDAASGKLLWQIVSHTDDSFDRVAFSPIGRYVLTGSFAQASLWDSFNGKLLRRFPMNDYSVNTVAFSRDGKLFLTGSNDWTARVWNVETAKELRRFEHQYWIDAAIFSPDGRYALTAGGAKTIMMWDVAGDKLLRQFDGQVEAIKRVDFAQEGPYLLTVNQNNVDVLWDTTSGKPVQRFAGDIKDHWSVTRSADGAFSLHAAKEDAKPLSDGSQIEKEVAPSKPPVNALVRPGEYSDDLDNYSPEAYEANKTAPRGVTMLWFPSYGEYYLTLNRDQTAVLMLDRKDNSEIRRFVSNAYIHSMGFSFDGKFVVTGGDDGATRLWDSATGKELAMLVSFEDGNWAVADPEGRFDTNDLDGGAPMQWVVDDDPMHALPLEIFMRNYYTPRLLARIMNGEQLPPIRSIAEITNRVQPDVAIVSVSASKKHPGRADVVVHAASHTNDQGQASGLQNLRLFRNGQLVANSPLDHPLQSGYFTFPDIKLPASAKQIAFTAYAFNHDDHQREQIKSATTPPTNFNHVPGPPAKPRAYLLQIGVNHYQATGCELHGSANDAEILSEILAERLTARGLDVKAVRLVSTVTQSGATKQSIRDALKEIAAAATPDDVFFLSFSGHGYGDKDGQFYILPSDIQGSCQGVDDAMLKSAISADELAEWLRPIDAGEMTFVLDSCDSASSVEANDFKPGPIGSRGLGQLAYDKRMRILAASQSNQAARESETMHQGLLSYALTQEGLVEGKADWKPVDQKITVGEWLSYAADEVPKFRESGEVKTEKGMTRIGAATPHLKSAQIPAVFNFSKTDAFVLQ
jgi:WD40 repeat protein